MRQFQAVIFDMDGVIVDSEARHERAFLEVVREIGYSDKLRLRFADYIGRSDQVLWVDFVARHEPPYTVEQLLVMKRDRMVELIRREAPLFDGMPALIERLAARYVLGLASGSERAVVEAVLASRPRTSSFTRRSCSRPPRKAAVLSRIPDPE